MLEIKHLSKTYKTKKQVVCALDDVSLTIQDKGMVFILGKSGSGKSTLLNVLGGLDSYDKGEIIIHGKSSKQFHQSDFDSYRNTFIGFIFQEYNVMDNFTVKENIELALQLQGKKVEETTLQNILKEVDLVGLANRKPNELSGGQLQRVAIARALIKEPEIIMADEPSGALDSKTGKQVFDTLKKLSKEKLVIVVSHDKEFAHQYADRIIELADGKIISDITKGKVEVSKEHNHLQIVDNQYIRIRNFSKLTKDDLQKLWDVLKQYHQDILILLKDDLTKEMKQRLHIEEDDIYAFKKTNSNDIRNENRQVLSLIKAKLPMKSSMKLACSNLKVKPIRLIITILLSVVAFTLFGITNTMSSYQKEVATFDSMKDQDIDYISIDKHMNIGSGLNKMDFATKLNDEDYTRLQKNYPNIAFTKTFSNANIQNSLDVSYNVAKLDVLQDENPNHNVSGFSGLSVMDENIIKQNGYSLDGALAKNDDEIVITKFLAETFVNFGYQYEDKQGKIQTKDIKKANDMIGNTIQLQINGETKQFVVTGILDTNINLQRYEVLNNDTEGMANYYLQTELYQLLYTSYHCLGYVSNHMLQETINRYNVYTLQTEEISLQMQDDYLSSSSVLYEKDIEQRQLVDYQDGDVYINYNMIKHHVLENGETVQQFVEQYVSVDMSQKESFTVMTKQLQLLKDELLKKSELYKHSYVERETQTLKIAGVYIPINSVDNEMMVVTKQGEGKMTIEKDGYMDFLIAPMCDDNTLKNVISYTYNDGLPNIDYGLRNQIMPMLETVNSVVFTLKDVLFWLGIGFALFAAAMFSNFIATSIANKKREIGILRAVGARGIDVLKIFLNEGFIIALCNACISMIVCFIGVQYMNHFINDSFSVIVTIFHFGLSQVMYIILVSVLVALLASAIPVYKISRKKPIDAIKNRK